MVKNIRKDVFDNGLQIMHNDRRSTNDMIKIAVVLAGVILITSATATFAAATESADEITSPNKTFFYQFIIAGGRIVWFVLLPMSVATLCLAIDLCFSMRRKKLLPPNIGTEIATIAKRIMPEQLPVRLSENNDLVSRTLLRTLKQCKHITTDVKHVQHIAAEALQEQGLILLRKVEWCNIIGNVAPMVGLFGTVFGMIQAFNILGISGGQPRHDQLAAKISIALVTTFWGLLIAIPALTIHGIFRSRVEALISEAAIEIENLLFQIPLHSRKKKKRNPTESETTRKHNSEKRSPPEQQELPATNHTEY
jgi:biopolymer transport protein ExbB